LRASVNAGRGRHLIFRGHAAIQTKNRAKIKPAVCDVFVPCWWAIKLRSEKFRQSRETFPFTNYLLGVSISP
jgi:hypothetical protein